MSEKQFGEYAAMTKNELLKEIVILNEKLAAAEAQVLAMRCCGNCEHYGDAKTCVECEEHYHLTGEKLFRWQPRTESDKETV